MNVLVILFFIVLGLMLLAAALSLILLIILLAIKLSKIFTKCRIEIFFIDVFDTIKITFLKLEDYLKEKIYEKKL